MKIGRIIGLIIGYINNRIFYGKKWFDCYSIFKEKLDDFFKKGDFGLGVFLVKKDEI